MEGNSEDVGVAMDSQKTIKRCKLESVPVPDPVTSEPVEDFKEQSTTQEQTKTSNSGFDCGTQSSDGEVFSEEFAFSIDHVFEQIMSSLDCTSLLTCRLVSYKWKLASTNVILKYVYTAKTFKYIPTDQVYHLKKGYLTDEDAVPKSTLEDLTRFLTESYSPSGPFKICEFSCNNFTFKGN